jgi:hypothetical protein
MGSDTFCVLTLFCSDPFWVNISFCTIRKLTHMHLTNFEDFARDRFLLMEMVYQSVRIAHYVFEQYKQKLKCGIL